MNKMSAYMLYATIVAGNCGYVLCSDWVASSTSISETTGLTEYMTTYPFSNQQGLVRLTDPLAHYERVEGQKMKITVARHLSNTVVVKAFLNQAQIKRMDHELDKESGYTRVPWCDDAIITDFSTYFSTYLKAKRRDKIRAGNRLAVRLDYPVHYHVTVPHDADVEVALTEGDITYETGRTVPTKLSIKGSSVSYWGQNGSSTSNGESWDYCWGGETDPITKLETQKGHIELPR